MKHRTRLFSGKPGTQYLAARFGSKTLFHDPVLAASKLDDTLPYGTLTAYLLRRFGYPNAGWDDYKELAKYRLTTAHPSMYLAITPSVSDATRLSVTFMVEQSTFEVAQAYERRHQTRWRTDALDRAQEKGLPEWMAEWEAHCNEVICPALQIQAGLTWRDACNLAHYDDSELGKKALAFYDNLTKEHQAYVPWPGASERPDTLEDWDDGDPLKPLALAAVQALDDLLTPVGVRDAAINAMGEVEYTGRERKAAPVSGYPSGALGNADPQGFAELHTLLIELGRGNAKRGIAKATEILAAHASTQRMKI